MSPADHAEAVRMCISFDIDDTLIVLSCGMPVESGVLPRALQQQLIWPLRFGYACAYASTTPARPSDLDLHIVEPKHFQIRLWLLFHGIAIDGVVNEGLHRKTLAKSRFDRMPSKYPPAFGIDLHVDDSEGVRMEGLKHGFRVIVVAPEDQHWAHKVLTAIGGLASK